MMNFLQYIIFALQSLLFSYVLFDLNFIIDFSSIFAMCKNSNSDKAMKTDS